MRYFIEGLQGDLQAYVFLNRPKNFEEAESLARMKDIVNKRQGILDRQSILTQMQTMFAKLIEQSSSNNKVKAAAAQAPCSSFSDEKLDELAAQIKQISKQKQQQQLNDPYLMAAYDQPSRPSHSFHNPHWQGELSRQLEKLQGQLIRLENELRRYQNPRRPDFRSCERTFRSTEGGPICTFCNRVGHTWRVCRQDNRDSFPFNSQPHTPMLPLEAPPHCSDHSDQGNA